jgi:AcrR family transcriptional regulator
MFVPLVPKQGDPTMGEKVLDRRIQRTRQLLQEALVALILEKGYESVTVQDVIDRANVGRSTFYAHFRDQEDLLLSGFETLRAQFEQHLTRQSAADGGPWNLSLMVFQHAQSQHRLYKALAGKQSGNVMLAHIHKYLTALIREHLKPQLSSRNKKEVIPPDVLAHYLVSSFMALLTWWLDHDLPYPAERMNDMYRQLTEPGAMAVIGE